jgi:large subunit ribosomal protein L17
MRHGKRGRILDRPRDVRRALYRGLLIALFREERIRTTLAKAKEIRGKAERLLSYAKQGDLAGRRLIASEIQDHLLVKKIVEEIAPRFKDRAGGYTRIFQLGPRLGDAAPMAQLALIGAPGVIKPEEGKDKPAAKKKNIPKPKVKKEEAPKPQDKAESGEEKPKRRGLKSLFGGGRKKPEGEGKE